MKRKLKVLILTHQSLIPPENAKEVDFDKAEWRTEYYVMSHLKHSGHQVEILGLEDDLKPIKTIQDSFKPHIVFNLVEQFKNEAVFDHNVVSYLELLGLPYTGCNPKGLVLARDKALSKTILHYHRIRTPQFFVAPRRKKFKVPKHIRYPVIIKSLTEEGSWGISQNSIVYDSEKLLERIDFIHSTTCSDAIIESYIEGREVYVGLMGNQRVQLLPPLELVFQNPSPHSHLIASRKAKWDHQYREKHQINIEPLKNMETHLRERITKVSKRIYNALHLTGYARLDLRVTPNGEIYFIEANPNPDIAKGDEFASAALCQGLSYSELMNRILSLGLKYQPTQIW